MQLFTKYARITLGATIIIFLFACIAYVFILERVFINQVDDALIVEKNEILVYVQKQKKLPEIIPVPDQQTYFKEIKTLIPANHQFKTIHNKNGSFRLIEFTVPAENKKWLITVKKSIDRTESLIHSIVIITFCTIFLILLIIFIINRFILRKLWSPFYKTINIVQQFKISRQRFPELETSGIDEFDLMNNTIKESANRAAGEYQLLKEFTENASHELQTPIAVIRSKLDIMIQDQALSEYQSKAASEAYDALERASKLNQSLAFLTRIENHQYQSPTSINAKTLIEEKILQFKELILSKHIELNTELHDNKLWIDPVLADALINNLLSNAIRHNKLNGKLLIECRPGEISIANSGGVAQLDHDKIFTRFYKDSPLPESQGLGLSIVKQICDMVQYRITYQFKGGMHIFVLNTFVAAQ